MLNISLEDSIIFLFDRNYNEEGIIFYEGNDKVVLADYIPKKYIQIR